jgi:uncharacterized membrane protein (Fun14 family)
MSETIAIQFLGALIAPFMVAYGIGYFIRKSIKLIAFMFGMFFVVVGVMWYAGVIDSFSGIRRWLKDILRTGYDKIQQLSNEIGKTVDNKKDGSESQMTIIVGLTCFFTGLIFGLHEGTGKNRGLRIISD